MPFYKSVLNVFDVIELQVGDNPRCYGDFFVEISEEEFFYIKNHKPPRTVEYDPGSQSRALTSGSPIHASH